MKNKKFKIGSYIKQKNDHYNGQWKVMADNGIWYVIISRHSQKMLFHSVARQQWVQTAENDQSAINSISA